MSMKVGDEVTWTSQAGGSAKRKKGVIVQVVAARSMPEPLPKHYGGGMWRDHESYVVDCRKSLTHAPNTYWPVASKLNIDRG
jgi:hypothetical protein